MGFQASESGRSLRLVTLVLVLFPCITCFSSVKWDQSPQFIEMLFYWLQKEETRLRLAMGQTLLFYLHHY